MIQITHLDKYYNRYKNTEFHALKDITLNIEDGEMCAIVGKSGAGKSTLLHILGGIDTYENGSYKLGTVEVGSLRESQLADFRNSHVGIVLQDFALVDGYSALENVMIPLRFARHRSNDMKKTAKNALEQVGMGEYAYKDINKLSGGQKQRVAIARAIVNNPDFILADEPTGALDSVSSQQIMEVLHNLNEKGKTIIVVTHDMQIADECDRRITISDGMIQNIK